MTVFPKDELSLPGPDLDDLRKAFRTLARSSRMLNGLVM